MISLTLVLDEPIFSIVINETLYGQQFHYVKFLGHLPLKGISQILGKQSEEWYYSLDKLVWEILPNRCVSKTCTYLYRGTK